MFKLRLHLVLFIAFSFNILVLNAYPEKIVIKNATDNAISYALDVRNKHGWFYQIAFAWLEPGEEYDINEKYFLQLDKFPELINYFRLAINQKQPEDMEPFSTADSSAVKFGDYKAVRIVVHKDKLGSLYHIGSPIHGNHKKQRKVRSTRDCYTK